MALIHRQATCGICGRPLGDGKLIAFPPFVRNVKDPMYLFHDSAFHHVCVESHPIGFDAIAARDRATKESMPGGMTCLVCGSRIEDAEDSFSAGLLVSDREDPAFKFNYVTIHSRHFTQWEQAEEFREVVGALMNRGSWRGPRLVFDPAPRWQLEEPETLPAGREVVVARYSPEGEPERETKK